MARRFEELGETRAAAARVDQVATQVLRTSSTAIGNLGTGLVVLLVVPALARGDATVGDVGLFAAAVSVLANLPRWAASTGAYHRQADVSVERMARLLPDRAPMGVVDAVTARRCATDRARSAPRAGPRARTSEPARGPPRARRVRAHGHPRRRRRHLRHRPHRRPWLPHRHHRPGRRRASPPCSAACSAWRPVDDGEVRWNGQLVDDPSQRARAAARRLRGPGAAAVQRAAVGRRAARRRARWAARGGAPRLPRRRRRLDARGPRHRRRRQGRAPLRRPDPAHRRRSRLRPPARAARDRRHLQRPRRRHRGPHVGASCSTPAPPPPCSW